MARENPLHEIRVFFRDIWKSTGFCWICMLVAVAAGIYAVVVLGTILPKRSNLSSQAWVAILAGAVVVTWFFAFILGVGARPADQRKLLEYPPRVLLRGIWTKGVPYALGTALLIGFATGTPVSATLLCALGTCVVANGSVGLAICGGTTATMTAVRMKDDPGIIIADSFRRTWLLYGLALLALASALSYGAGVSAGLASGSGLGSMRAAALPTLEAVLINSTFATGYVSGYYP